jgi:hypothetical protein
MSCEDFFRKYLKISKYLNYLVFTKRFVLLYSLSSIFTLFVRNDISTCYHVPSKETILKYLIPRNF